MPETQAPTPADAFELLLAGNRRFVAGTPQHPNQDATRRAQVAPGQRPFAVLFGCSDSRLAAEIIFDRGLGDLFVVRTAGHVLGAEVLADWPDRTRRSCCVWTRAGPRWPNTPRSIWRRCPARTSP